MGLGLLVGGAVTDDLDVEAFEGRPFGLRCALGDDDDGSHPECVGGVGHAEAMIPGRTGDDPAPGIQGGRGGHRRQCSPDLERAGRLEGFELEDDVRAQGGTGDDRRRHQMAGDDTAGSSQVVGSRFLYRPDSHRE
jgi:hypothetical protein